MYWEVLKRSNLYSYVRASDGLLYLKAGVHPREGKYPQEYLDIAIHTLHLPNPVTPRSGPTLLAGASCSNVNNLTHQVMSDETPPGSHPKGRSVNLLGEIGPSLCWLHLCRIYSRMSLVILHGFRD